MTGVLYTNGAWVYWCERKFYDCTRQLHLKSICTHTFTFFVLKTERTTSTPKLFKLTEDIERVSYLVVCCSQCDQIGRFIAVWVTFHSLWQQLICPNCRYNLHNFCKGGKIYHFSSEIILGIFYRHLAIFSGHTVGSVSTYLHKAFTLIT